MRKNLFRLRYLFKKVASRFGAAAVAIAASVPAAAGQSMEVEGGEECSVMGYALPVLMLLFSLMIGRSAGSCWEGGRRRRSEDNDKEMKMFLQNR